MSYNKEQLSIAQASQRQICGQSLTRPFGALRRLAGGACGGDASQASAGDDEPLLASRGTAGARPLSPAGSAGELAAPPAGRAPGRSAAASACPSPEAATGAAPLWQDELDRYGRTPASGEQGVPALELEAGAPAGNVPEPGQAPGQTLPGGRPEQGAAAARGAATGAANAWQGMDEGSTAAQGGARAPLAPIALPWNMAEMPSTDAGGPSCPPSPAAPCCPLAATAASPGGCALAPPAGEQADVTTSECASSGDHRGACGGSARAGARGGAGASRRAARVRAGGGERGLERVQYASGDEYAGEVAGGMAAGLGVYAFAGGGRYEGEVGPHAARP